MPFCLAFRLASSTCPYNFSPSITSIVVIRRAAGTATACEVKFNFEGQPLYELRQNKALGANQVYDFDASI